MTVYNSLSDQELTALLKEGDQAAFMEIYERYKAVLHKHGFKWLQDREEVKDVIQELFTSLWAKRESISLNNNLSGYLYTSVRNSILRKISKGKLQQEYLNSISDFEKTGASITDHLVRENQLRTIIEKEVASLPEKMREIFELSRNAHLSHAEIAEKLGISELTVKTQVKRALRVLRGKLGLFLYLYLVLFY